MNKKNDRKNDEKSERKSELAELFKNYRVVGVVGDKSTAKSSLVLSELLLIKQKHPRLNIYVFGVEENLREYLEKQGIIFLNNMEDVLQSKIKNSIIYVDEINEIVSSKAQSKQTAKFKRMLNRTHHQNTFLIFSTAEQGYYNKMVCGVIDCFIVKQTTLDTLVNNTWLKKMVLGLPRFSEYKVDLDINQFYVLDNNGLTRKCSFPYNPNLDSKKNNINPFK